MALEQLTNLADFQDNYEIHNGQIADAASLNLAVHRVQQEMIALWNFVRSDIQSINTQTNLIDDSISASTEQVRSITGIHNETFNGGTWS